MTARIGFIGLGNMGAAIIGGLSAHEDLEIHGVDLDTAKMEGLRAAHGMVPHSDPAELVATCDYVVLAVKPQHAEKVLEGVVGALDEKTCLLSICAGIPQDKLRELSGRKCPVVRVMPNTPALVGEGVYAVCLEDSALSDDMKAFVPDVLGRIGQVHVLPESQFDAFTAVIGSGPAYVFYFMEALIESGVELGLTRDQSTRMVEGLFTGSSKLAAESELHVSQLREMVTSPAGTTIQALIHMDRTATRGNIIDAVRESYLRSIELGKQ